MTPLPLECGCLIGGFYESFVNNTQNLRRTWTGSLLVEIAELGYF